MLSDESPLDAGPRLGQSRGQRKDFGNQVLILGHDNVSYLI
jgi:hypothetical protein